LNKPSELQELEKEFERLSDADLKEPGKYALQLNALGEGISLLRKEASLNKPLEPPVPIGKDLVAIAIDDLGLVVQFLDGRSVAMGSLMAHTHGRFGWALEVPVIRNLMGDVAIEIENCNSFPNANFLDMPKNIDMMGAEDLFYLGKDDDEEPLVSTIKCEDERLYFFAVPLVSLLAHSQEPINIPDPLPEH
jgi:hypothetical protein